jgi:hypothetical protein
MCEKGWPRKLFYENPFSLIKKTVESYNKCRKKASWDLVNIRFGKREGKSSPKITNNDI